MHRARAWRWPSPAHDDGRTPPGSTPSRPRHDNPRYVTVSAVLGLVGLRSDIVTPQRSRYPHPATQRARASCIPTTADVVGLRELPCVMSVGPQIALKSDDQVPPLGHVPSCSRWGLRLGTRFPPPWSRRARASALPELHHIEQPPEDPGQPEVDDVREGDQIHRRALQV